MLRFPVEHLKINFGTPADACAARRMNLAAPAGGGAVDAAAAGGSAATQAAAPDSLKSVLGLQDKSTDSKGIDWHVVSTVLWSTSLSESLC